MKTYQPMSSGERAAVAVVSGTVSLSLVTGLLVMFNDGRLPRFDAEPATTLAAADCTRAGPASLSCLPLAKLTPQTIAVASVELSAAPDVKRVMASPLASR